MFAYQDTDESVDVAFTDRHGGISPGAFRSLDLSTRDPDRVDEVEENIDLLAYAMARGHEDAAAPFSLPTGVRVPSVVLMHQVHGADVTVVDQELLGQRGRGPDPVADALVTTLPGVMLLVRVADCVPVLLADPVAGVVGAAHAGRPGLVAGIVPRAVEAMRELGACRLRAWVGPHVCGACYEVPERMRADVTAAVPESFAETSWGTPSVDIGAGVMAQLAAAGVETVDASRCTMEHGELYSYRRQGEESGRLGGLVWVRP
ncbi:MAG: polyphenol oxidase family protein [Nocardioidaceae bacterium]